MENSLKKILVAVLLILAGVLSFFVISGKAASVDTHQDTIASIDDKVDTVLKLTATSTLASAGISAIPGDTATPVAEKLADFTEYFLLILCILYAEKYLLTIIGAGAFKILIPLACALLAVSIFHASKGMKKLAAKIAIFAVALYAVIPLSLRVSDMVYAVYSDSINETITTAEEFTDETSEITEAEGNDSLIQSILDRISETTSSLSSRAAGILSNYVESLAVMIVTACIIPILVLLFFIWLIKILTGIDIQLPMKRHHDDRPDPNGPAHPNHT